MYKDREQNIQVGEEAMKKLLSNESIDLLVPTQIIGEDLKVGDKIPVRLDDGREITFTLISDPVQKPAGHINPYDAKRCGYGNCWAAWEDLSLNRYPGISMGDMVAIISIKI